MKREDKMVQIGNTSFNKGIASTMKYSQFKAVYADKLKGMDLDKVWQELGGKLPKRSD